MYVAGVARPSQCDAAPPGTGRPPQPRRRDRRGERRQGSPEDIARCTGPSLVVLSAAVVLSIAAVAAGCRNAVTPAEPLGGAPLGQATLTTTGAVSPQCMGLHDPLNFWGTAIVSWADEPCVFLQSTVGIMGYAVRMPLGCPGADLPPHLEAVYTAIAQVSAVEGHNVPGRSGGFSPSVNGPPRAPRGGGDTSPCAQTAVPAPLGSRCASNGVEVGALRAPGAGGDASPSAQSAIPEIFW